MLKWVPAAVLQRPPTSLKRGLYRGGACPLPRVFHENVATWQHSGTNRFPPRSPFCFLGLFTAFASDGRGASLSQLAQISSLPQNVAFVGICSSACSPGESFTRVGCHGAARVITKTEVRPACQGRPIGFSSLGEWLFFFFGGGGQCTL